MEIHAGGPVLPIVLSVAGFDPTGGAGVTADLKTFAAHNCYGVAVVTSLAVQNTSAMLGRYDTSPDVVAEQIRALAEDMPLSAVKVGMLGSAGNVEVVAAALERYSPPFVVLDPVFRSTSGAELLDAAGIEALCARLLPKVTLITPNIDEAARLAGQEIQNLEQMKSAAASLHARYGVRVVITGGHLDKPQDLFYDGSDYSVFAGDRIRSENTHGTGCAFSSAIAANLALGKSLPDAIVLAKAFVTKAIEKGYPLGRGPGLLNHLYRLQASPQPRPLVIAEMAESHTAGHR
jgi:hydroxymethylpyrimidine/phosphomethylpyrimidine kinase